MIYTNRNKNSTDLCTNRNKNTFAATMIKMLASTAIIIYIFKEIMTVFHKKNV